MMTKSDPYQVGKVLGFYEAGDKVMDWINSTDSEHMSALEFRKALYQHLLQMRPD